MAKIKLSDYVAKFLVEQNIKHVFAISGGASLHLIHSIAHTKGIDYICPHHEQAGAMAAEAYSRATKNLGCAVATSGPGATNLLTGICCAFYDSIPVLYLTGQVASFRLKKDTGVRQFGFQETTTVEICETVTKYAVMIKDPMDIRYELEKAVYLAKEGRPGPVVVDIPDNLQREMIEELELRPFERPEPNLCENSFANEIDQCVAMLKEAKRPVIIYGSGVRLARAEKEALAVLEKTGFPVIPTWGMVELLPANSDQLVGTFGLHGTRYGNFAVQNADLVFSVGTRLDTHETGSPMTTFARDAKKIIVDIDASELDKFPKFDLPLELPIRADAKHFLEGLLGKLESFESQDLQPWKAKIAHWKTKYDICPPRYSQSKNLNPYVFFTKLSDAMKGGESIAIDTGCAVAWFMQSFKVKPGQHIFSALNNTPMGYALPAAIGASFANGNKEVFCVSGDGGLMMNIQEMATVMHHKLPIKLIVINNHGYSMIQQTQDQWLESEYFASSNEGGLSFPDFNEVAKAHGFETCRISKNSEIDGALEKLINCKGPIICDVDLDPKERVIPQVKFGRPIEDSGPLLERDDFLGEMIIEPLDVSRNPN